MQLLAGNFFRSCHLAPRFFTFAMKLEVDGGLGKDPRLNTLLLSAPVSSSLHSCMVACLVEWGFCMIFVLSPMGF